jgi:hypothetical protein
MNLSTSGDVELGKDERMERQEKNSIATAIEYSHPIKRLVRSRRFNPAFSIFAIQPYGFQ